jgi:hypothetical protein
MLSEKSYLDIFYLPGCITTIGFCCGAPFRVLSAIEQASSLFPFSHHCEQSEAREGTVLHYTSKLHKLPHQLYNAIQHFRKHCLHIIFITLLNTFGKHPLLSVSPKSKGCVWMASSFGGGREEASLLGLSMVR